jgi:hypoxanthine phosphoribosyltransferase
MIRIDTKIFLSWDDIKDVVEKIAEKINNLERKPFYLYGVPRGGLIPATWLSHKTGIKYQQINAVQISKMADLSHILIIDDICDSGKTVKEIRKNYPKVKVACLYYKETASETPDIYGEIVGDDWLVFPWETDETPGQRDNTYGEL